jgi:hypothetical protein
MKRLNRKDLSKLDKKKDCKETRIKSSTLRLMRRIKLFNNFKLKYSNCKLTFKLKIKESDFCRNS